MEFDALPPVSEVALWVMQAPGSETEEECMKLERWIDTMRDQWTAFRKPDAYITNNAIPVTSL